MSTQEITVGELALIQKRAEDRGWLQGVAYAAGYVARERNDDGFATEIVTQANFTLQDLIDSGADDYDLNPVRQAFYNEFGILVDETDDTTWKVLICCGLDQDIQGEFGAEEQAYELADRLYHEALALRAVKARAKAAGIVVEPSAGAADWQVMEGGGFRKAFADEAEAWKFVKELLDTRSPVTA